MGITKVTRNYQITLPKDVRKTAGIKVGDEIIVKTCDSGIMMRKLKSDAFEKAFGILKGPDGDSAEYVRNMREGSEKRRMRLGL
ncbi:AbrB/MazE/SpoVT family DNA-binding domain-containing protein [Candidatus Woesearchaeota archaeon]|nr:AbrB/MazE/SpoVT family DNA-binding domain-containing protein [Candidatus Woesearchaeota archaeon]